jgi:bacterioferritin (cytochrome b1)
LAALLNEDLSREYQAIIAYVVYSQVLKGAEYMNIAAQFEQHAHQELEHALIISRQIDYLGKMPTVTAKPVKTSEKMRDMLKFDLDNENTTIINYRERIRQCEALSEPWRSRSARFSFKSRTIRSISPRRSARTSRTLAACASAKPDPNNNQGTSL